MSLTLLFRLFMFTVGCNSFLLDDRTPSPTNAGSIITDHHFNMLFNLLADEKQARVKLEQVVQQLQQELLVTQQGVTGIYHSGQKYNDTLALQYSALISIDDKYTDLQTRYNSLKLEFNELRTTHFILQNHTNKINQELAVLKQLKSVTDLQAILSVQNQSQHLEEELQATNSMLNSVATEVSARNQDFVALFNKADATERKLELTVNQMGINKNNTDALLQKLEHNHNVSQTQLNTTIQTELSMIRSNQNSTVANLKTELYDLYHKFPLPDRVAVTSCAQTDNYKAGSTILFPIIHTRIGISNNGVTSLGNTGKFVCERPGLYQITAFVTTSQQVARVNMYKNGVLIAYNCFSVTWLQTHTIIILEQLNVNDSVYIEANGDMFIYGDHDSCMSILQITG